MIGVLRLEKGADVSAARLAGTFADDRVEPGFQPQSGFLDSRQARSRFSRLIQESDIIHFPSKDPVEGDVGMVIEYRFHLQIGARFPHIGHLDRGSIDR